MSRALPAPTRAFRLATSGPAARAVQAAVELGLPDLLAVGPAGADALAHPHGWHGPSVERLLGALASVGVFARLADGRYAATPLSECLRADVPGSVRGAAIAAAQVSAPAFWGDLAQSVRTGRPAFEERYGRPFFDYLADHPEAAARFDAGMAQASEGQTEAVLAAYDFTGLCHVVDVGGGTGAFLAAVLAAHPHLCGTLLDLPHVVADPAPLRAAGVADRCSVVSGDFRQGVPSGADAYVLKAVVHDWPDREAIALLAACRAALAPVPGARVLVIEMVRPNGARPHPSLFVDLDLMVLTGGRERTRREFADLLLQAGLRLARVVRTGCPLCVLEARPYSRTQTGSHPRPAPTV